MSKLMPRNSADLPSACRLLSVLILLAGCGLKPGRHDSEQSSWMSSRYTSNDSAWLYLNFYQEYEDFDRYQGYGVVGYTRDSQRDSQRPDEFWLHDSLRLCREQFSKAYHEKTLTRYASEGKDGKAPFQLRFVAVVVGDKAQSTPELGVVVPADQLFSKAPLKDLISQATITRGIIVFDDLTEEEKQRGWSPGKSTRYTHIEAHMAETKLDAGDTTSPDAK